MQGRDAGGIASFANASEGGQVLAGPTSEAAPPCQHSWSECLTPWPWRQSLSTMLCSPVCRRLQKLLYFPHTFRPECPPRHSSRSCAAASALPRAGVGDAAALPWATPEPWATRTQHTLNSAHPCLQRCSCGLRAHPAQQHDFRGHGCPQNLRAEPSISQDQDMLDDWETTFPGIPWGAVLGRPVLPSAPLSGEH